MKSYILSIVLVLSLSACRENKSTTTTTTTETTAPSTPSDTAFTPIEPSATQNELSDTGTTSESMNAPAKSKSTTSTSTTSKSTTSKSQTKQSSPSSPGDDIVNKALYTKTERESTRKNLLNDINKIDMSPELRAQYLAIIEKHIARIRTANNERKMTKTQATDYVNRVMREQNSEVKRILSVEQYNQHMLMMNRYQNSVLYRIEQQ